MNGNAIALICHTLVCVALVVAYTITREPQIIAGLFGYLGGAGAQAASKSATATGA